MEEIIRFKPKAKDDLMKITGFGAVKIGKYGEDIINILNFK
jgi:HRDC domain